MQISVGYGDHPDSVAAGKQAAQMALDKAGRTEPCDLALLFCTARHNQKILRETVVSVVKNTENIWGGGSAGVITNDYFGYAGDQVGLACIWL
ncbi:MAG: diguanylate cyclase, partial [Eubacterium sp.]